MKTKNLIFFNFLLLAILTSCNKEIVQVEDQPTISDVEFIDGIPYKCTTIFEDGTTIIDEKIDGIIYKKLNDTYYKRVYSGAINTSWYGAVGDGKIDDSKAVQKAVSWCVKYHKDLEVDGNCLITESIVINRKVDSKEFDHYFTIFSNSGGGFVTQNSIPIFTTTLPFVGLPISQLINFKGLNFRNLNSLNKSYVLDGSKFLRIQFSDCSFNGIQLLYAEKYIQTIYLSNCNIRYWKRDFLKSLDTCFDVKILGCIAEHGDGNCLYLTLPTGCSVQNSVIEGLNGSAVVFNGARGINISGNYFEGNKDADINMSISSFNCGGIAIIGNFFANQNITGNIYSILWSPKNISSGCVSQGNYSHSNLHFFYDKSQYEQMKPFIQDTAKIKMTNFD